MCVSQRMLSTTLQSCCGMVEDLVVALIDRQCRDLINQGVSFESSIRLL